MFAFAWPMRLSLSMIAQLVLVGTSMRNNKMLFEALISSPLMRHVTHAMYQLLCGLLMMVPLPVVRHARLSPVAKACAVMAWLQIGVGLVVPLLWEAVSEACLHSLHEQQLRHAGLPQRRGLQADAHRFVWSLTQEGSKAHVAFLYWMLLSIAWNGVALWYAASDAG
ncbi:hypothetical protein CHLNCDRAFT_138937 [Chlorella variabilis]|uniref:Uncharacterized protein n=1 Tax=Chlorella variabilis TaxID=554065 RepID=E1ZNZ7_CHLVA|nr:hypothetical protein CHLNCDRAFT_138937 [Chlorella variabilis]EFN52527.1 hypothetical protein CHLNCDRAFT_138937 [Chlorella variabilis]|eukprot:XP_005844629.1 hypothetical protein CHLNCDRAFT_138937 [Chlorella variabilis]